MKLSTFSFLGSAMLIVLIFSVTSCKKDFSTSEVDSWDWGMAVPIGHAELTLADFIPDDNENIQINGDQTITFTYREDSILSYAVADLFEIPSQQGETEEFKLGIIDLDNFGPIEADVSLDDMLLQLNPLLAANIQALDGTNAPFPAMNSQNSQEFDFDNFDDFEYVSFSDGGLIFSIKNNLPVAFGNAQLVLSTIDPNNVLIDVGTFDFSDLQPGATQSDSIELDGVTLYNSFKATLVSFSTVPSISPVLIDLSSGLELSLNSYDLKVIGGKAKLPQQALESITETLDFGVSEQERITHLKLKNAAINYEVQSSFAIDFDFILTFPTAEINNLPVIYYINTTNNPSGVFDLSGVEFDFTTDPVQAYNVLPFEINFAMGSADQWVVFDSGSVITFSYSLEDLEFELVQGWVGNKEIIIDQDTVELDFSELEQLSGAITLDDPKFNLLVDNNIGLPIGFNIDLVNHTIDDDFISLGADLLELPYPTVIGQEIIEEKVSLSNANSNLSEFMSLLPQELYIGGSVHTNPNTDTNSVVYDNFVTDDGNVNLGLEIELPLALSVDNLNFSDTIDVSINTDDIEDIEYGKISVVTLNGLPFEADVVLTFYNSQTNTTYDSYSINILDPAIADDNGLVIQATEKITEIEFDNAGFMNMANADKIIVEATVNTSNTANGTVEFFTDYTLDVRLGLLVRYNLEINLP